MKMLLKKTEFEDGEEPMSQVMQEIQFQKLEMTVGNVYMHQDGGYNGSLQIL